MQNGVRRGSLAVDLKKYIVIGLMSRPSLPLHGIFLGHFAETPLRCVSTYQSGNPQGLKEVIGVGFTSMVLLKASPSSSVSLRDVFREVFRVHPESLVGKGLARHVHMGEGSHTQMASLRIPNHGRSVSSFPRILLQLT
jgi:hypothetical protein